MKRIVILILMCAAMAACKKEEPAPQPTPPTPTDGYNVMYWSNPGDNDRTVLLDFLTLLEDRDNGKIAENVRFHGVVKPSKRFIQYLVGSGLDKTFYFDLGGRRELTQSDKEKLAVVADSLSITRPTGPTDKAIADAYKTIFSYVEVKSYGTLQLPMNNPDSIAKFIKDQAAKYPDYQPHLMLLGHGDGFVPNEDIPLKACLDDPNRSDETITLDQMISGIKKSQVKIQMIFTQCCLMAAFENLVGYSQVVSYAIAATETTYSGYFPKYMVFLTEFGTGVENLKKACMKTVDYYVTESPFVTHYIKTYPLDTYTTQGFYDLTQMGSVLGTVKNIAGWLTANYDKDTIFFNNELYKVQNSTPVTDESLQPSRAILKKIYAGTAVKSDITSKEKMDTLCNVVSYLVNNSNNNMGYCLAHMVYRILQDSKQATGKNIDFATLQTFYDSYMTAIKNSSHIRGTFEDQGSLGKDFIDYVLLSPTVNIFTLNETYYKALKTEITQSEIDALWTSWSGDKISDVKAEFEKYAIGCRYATQYSAGTTVIPATPYSTIKANYQACDFDKATGWSSFLQKITVTPNIVKNPFRMDIQNEQ